VQIVPTGEPGAGNATISQSGNASVDVNKCWNGAGNSTGLDFGNVYQDPTVKKTAVPAFTRTYNWNISKNVDKTFVEQVGGTATFNYTVVAAETGFTDSAWNVTGTITLTNSSPEDFTGVTVNDAVDDGGTCTVASFNGTVPAGQSVQLLYSCTYSNAPSPAAGKNTATAYWGSAFPTLHPSGTGSATFDFGQTPPSKTLNKTVTITDTFNGTLTTLGTATATDSTPYTSQTFKYAHTITVLADKCATYPNTATIKETGQTAGQSVQVCGAVAGGLTMGFWQNKNGQAIITGGASTAGACNSGTFLRAYTPFQDLKAGATCAATGTYVTNIIKAASAAGATENPMLKAQMLATALDVYFSDPTSAGGGNKIGAPVPLGGINVDLTKICIMIDGSGGTASCSGKYQNVSAAFGNATSKTVSNMLNFENTVSNSGGSIWYGQIKATQDLAKNAFDAINNAVAFTAP
jgi:hypothetical protein